jgi:hypothetical protein
MTARDIAQGRDYEERRILERLEDHATVYCIRRDAALAALRLQDRGLVACRVGEGRDVGLLLVQTAVRRPRLVLPGGAA